MQWRSFAFDYWDAAKYGNGSQRLHIARWQILPHKVE